MRKGRYLLGLLIGAYAQTNVGIGTTNPTHRLHLALGTLRIEALSGTGTVLAQVDNQGVLGRFSTASSSSQFLRGDGTWGLSSGDWKLIGNSGTNPSIHYVGTVDAQDFRLATHNQTAWRILSTGEHWIGRNTTSTLEEGLVSVQAPAGWIAVYGHKSLGEIPAVRGTIGSNTIGPAVMALNTDPNGWGAIGLGSGANIGTLPTNGGGAYGAGNTVGVWGTYESNGDYAGGAFAVRDGGGTYNWVYVGGQQGTARKIWGPGNVSTNIYDASSQQYHTLFAPEMPEVLFWDQGRFTLTSSTAWVPIDPLLSQYIAPPFMVWLQPYGEISVRVREISERGFWIEAEASPSTPVEVGFLLQARRKGTLDSPYHLERMPSVPPEKFFTPFRPVYQYYSPKELHDAK